MGLQATPIIVSFIDVTADNFDHLTVRISSYEHRSEEKTYSRIWMLVIRQSKCLSIREEPIKH